MPTTEDIQEFKRLKLQIMKKESASSRQELSIQGEKQETDKKMVNSAQLPACASPSVVRLTELRHRDISVASSTDSAINIYKQ
jgi:hypothetical protein